MIKPKKSLGQHFLKDIGVAVETASLQKGEVFDMVIEVGPGQGVLTQKLYEIYKDRLLLVEKDDRCIPLLKERFPNAQLLNADFLRIDWNKVKGDSIMVIGNYPYNISSQIIFKSLEARNRVKAIVGMFQKELAERLASGPGSKKYGVISVFLQAFYDVKLKFDVGPEKFDPPPKVWSSVIQATRNSITELGCDEAAFKKLVKQAFQQRRKKLSNALKGIILMHPEKEEISSLSYFSKRAEALSVDDFIKLTNLLL
jgi:16S rRNA (adenine1518-N6/adenine1519-N6)-dimethyltransferase